MSAGRPVRLPRHRLRPVPDRPAAVAGDAPAIAAVQRATDTMRAALSERLTVDDLARSALFTKFHFTRLFARVTGLSPGRYLSALRIDEAKRRLVAGQASIADITQEVGYSSAGTFSSRFHDSVGVCPREYRERGGVLDETPRPPATGTGRVRGAIALPDLGTVGDVFVGLFPGRLIEGAPAGHTVLERPGAFTLEGVAAGQWHVMVHAWRLGPGGDPDDAPEPERFLAVHGPITVPAVGEARVPVLRLSPARPWTPPVLLGVLDAPAALPAPLPALRSATRTAA